MRPVLLGFDARGKRVLLQPDDARIHQAVFGASGSGKSKYLENLMRQFLMNDVGFSCLDPHGSLYESMVAYCAHHAIQREIILINVSDPNGEIVGFNPFERTMSADISVQVDRRIAATMHAWGVQNTDQTPTLARILRLIYTIMLELNLGLSEIAHLIDFSSREIRSAMIDRLDSTLIQNEWRELQQLRAKEWRDETLSAKNRLFKFLTSLALRRFMGIPGRSIDPAEIMDSGKVVLVNLAESDFLSGEGSRTFGALFVNSWFEAALRRRPDERGRGPRCHYLILDEFQFFVSTEIAAMLDQVRKFGLFLCLSTQRIGGLSDAK